MADQKLTQLTALVSAAVNDLLYIVDDPGGTPISKKITVGDLLAGVEGSVSALTSAHNALSNRVSANSGTGGAASVTSNELSTLTSAHNALSNRVSANSGTGVSTLNSLADVSAPTPANGDVLTYVSALSSWVADAPTTGATELDDLTDVDAPTPSDGDVLTFDSGSGDWVPAAPAVGGGGASGPWEFIDEIVGSGTSSIDFTSCITADYDVYLVTIVDMIHNSAARPFIRCSTDNGSSFDSGSNYDYNINYSYSGGSGGVGANSTTAMYWRDTTTTLHASGVWAGHVLFYSPLGAKHKQFYAFVGCGDASLSLVHFRAGGMYKVTTAVDAIQIGVTAGTITSGYFRIYGLKNTGGSGGGTVPVGTVNGRLTTESGVPTSSSDRTSQSTIYFTPFNGNQIALYDGADWQLETFSELSLALSGLTSGKAYDVFVDYNGGTPQLVLGTAWTNDTTRAVALTTQDGVYVLTGATDHRYVGTIYTTGTTTTEDSAANRYVWNLYNREQRNMLPATETTDSWTYTTGTFRQTRASSANQINYVAGLAIGSVEAEALSIVTNSGAGLLWVAAGIGVDSTSVNSSPWNAKQVGGSRYDTVTAGYRGPMLAGRHYLAWLEFSEAAAVTTWLGDGGVSGYIHSGMHGTVWN